MATSGTISSTMTARQVVTRAMKLLAAVGGGQTLSAEDAEDGMETLNFMLKSMQADGANLWREEEISQVCVAGQLATLLVPRPVDVLEARVVTGYQRTLSRWGRGEYEQIPNKTSPGTPTCYFLDQQRDETYIRLWPVQDTDTVLLYTAARVIEDVTELDQNIDVPQMWLECICYMLAVRLYPLFGSDRIDAVRFEADRLYTKMLDHDRPASIYMGGVGR